MIVRKSVAAFAVVLSSCAASEQPRPDPEGVIVLEVPSATAARPGSAPLAVVAAAERPLDLDGCILEARKAPPPSATDLGGSTLYDAGLAAEKRGDTTSARKGFFEMIQGFPTSSYRPLGYFAFGELFRAEAATDPSKIEFAMQSYAETLKFPPPGNPLYEIALFRSAELNAMKGEGAKVLDGLTKLAQSRPPNPCARELRARMEEMLVPAYAATGSPDKAAMFFSRLGTQEVAARLTARLARLYVSQQKGRDALIAIKSLTQSSLPPNAAMCGEALQVAQELGDVGVIRDLGAKCANQ
jgi:hypothetical protein